MASHKLPNNMIGSFFHTMEILDACGTSQEISVDTRGKGMKYGQERQHIFPGQMLFITGSFHQRTDG